MGTDDRDWQAAVDWVYLKTRSPLVVARRALRGGHAGYVLAYPEQHAVQFLNGTPTSLGIAHPAAPYLLARCLMGSGRIPLLRSIEVSCLTCDQPIPLRDIGVGGLCRVCRPSAMLSCCRCGSETRSDHLLNGECLLCLTVARIFRILDVSA